MTSVEYMVFISISGLVYEQFKDSGPKVNDTGSPVYREWDGRHTQSPLPHYREGSEGFFYRSSLEPGSGTRDPSVVPSPWTSPSYLHPLPWVPSTRMSRSQPTEGVSAWKGGEFVRVVRTVDGHRKRRGGKGSLYRNYYWHGSMENWWI